jgi:hypothetical protein
MHKEAAGIATEIPTVSLVAAMGGVSKPFKRKDKDERTDITPHRRNVVYAVRPDKRVYEAVEAGERRPYHKKTCPRVPRLEMPGQGDEGKDESKERKDGEGGKAGVGKHWKGGRRWQW